MNTVRLQATRHYQEPAAARTLCGKSGATLDQFRHGPADCRVCIRIRAARNHRARK